MQLQQQKQRICSKAVCNHIEPTEILASENGNGEGHLPMPALVIFQNLVLKRERNSFGMENIIDHFCFITQGCNRIRSNGNLNDLIFIFTGHEDFKIVLPEGGFFLNFLFHKFKVKIFVVSCKFHGECAGNGGSILCCVAIAHRNLLAPVDLGRIAVGISNTVDHNILVGHGVDFQTVDIVLSAFHCLIPISLSDPGDTFQDESITSSFLFSISFSILNLFLFSIALFPAKVKK